MLAQDNLGVKKASAPSKNLLKCPIMYFAPDKKNVFCAFRISGTCPKEKERESDGERERERKRERERESKSERERERERGKVPAIIFLNRLGQSKKSAKYVLK